MAGAYGLDASSPAQAFSPHEDFRRVPDADGFDVRCPDYHWMAGGCATARMRKAKVAAIVKEADRIVLVLMDENSDDCERWVLSQTLNDKIAIESINIALSRTRR